MWNVSRVEGSIIPVFVVFVHHNNAEMMAEVGYLLGFSCSLILWSSPTIVHKESILDGMWVEDYLHYQRSRSNKVKQQSNWCSFGFFSPKSFTNTVFSPSLLIFAASSKVANLLQPFPRPWPWFMFYISSLESSPGQGEWMFHLFTSDTVKFTQNVIILQLYDVNMDRK